MGLAGRLLAYIVFLPEKKDFILVDSEGNAFERYNVKFKNTGSKKIKVKDIILCGSLESSKALCGELKPQEIKSYGCFDKTPDMENILEWINLDSKETFRKKIKIQLPKKFYGRILLPKIVFYINSDTNQVQVAYEIFSPGSIIVDNDGKHL